MANLPFYLTAPVIRKFLESENRPKEMVLVVQKEVGQRICAKPPEMSILAVSVQFYVHPLKSNEAGAKQFNGAGPEIIAFISKKSFYPPPRTDGAILKISAFNQREKSAFNQWFFKIVKAGFSHPRKQLINNLSGGLKMDRANVKSWLLKNNIRPEQRAETLAVEDWINLAKSLRIGVNLGLN